MKMTEYRNRIRQDFLDIGPETSPLIFSDVAINRAVASSIEDFSRYVPNLVYHEIVVNSSTKTDTFLSTGITVTSEVTLDEFPVRIGGTFTITKASPAVTYVEGTDYIIDRTNGLVTFPVGSAIIALADAITLTITYELSRQLFNLSALPAIRSIDSVQMYSGSSSYGNQEDFFLVGNYLQYAPYTEITNGYRIIGTYLAVHISPDDNQHGSVPDVFCELIIKGAEANLLYSKAISLELSESTNYPLTTHITSMLADLASARAELLSAATQVDTAVSVAAGAGASIAAHWTSATNKLALAETNLTAAIAELTTSKTKVDTEVEGDLTLAAGEVANANTLIGTIGTEIGTYLAILDDFVGRLTAAMQYLTDGDAFLNTVNVGDNVAALYAEYSKGVVEVMKVDISGGSSLIAAVGERIKLISAEIANATVFIENAKIRLNLGQFYQSVSDRYLKVSEAYINEALMFVEMSKVQLQTLVEFLTISTRFVEVAQGYQKNAEIINQLMVEIRSQSTFIIEVSERIRAEATRRYNDFNAQIRDRSGTYRSRVEIGKQLPPPR